MLTPFDVGHVTCSAKKTLKDVIQGLGVSVTGWSPILP